MREPGSILGYASLPAFLAVLVALPFVASERPPATQPSPTASAERAPQEARSPGPGSFRMGRDLLARTTGRSCCTLERPDSLRVLVALLPDPDQSSLDWNYDASLSAIRRALEAAGYTSDRSWFPSGDSTVTVPDNGATRTLPLPQAEPAVLVFRGDDGASTRKLAIVYVVGEVPTTGVHKEALRTALSEASILEAGDTLRLLGPSFSGSTPSLRAVLETLPDDMSRFHVRIVSGSATATRNRGVLTDSLDTPLAGVGYGTTVHTDDAYAAALEREVLEPLALHGSEVALLTESNTGYGAALAPEDETGNEESEDETGNEESEDETGNEQAEDEDAGDLEAGDVGAGDEQRGEEQTGDAPSGEDATEDPASEHSLAHAVNVPFPLNIAALRAEYARNPADTVRGAFRLPGRSSRVPLSLQLRSRPLEVPPPRSRLTAPALDIAMGDVLRTLRSHQVKAVGILASDVRDKLFLAGLVRRDLPDALLFTFEGNALFQRPELSRGLRGMIVVSTYPLILENAVWTGNPALLSFPAESALGVFNATLLLLGAPRLMYQYRPPGLGPVPPDSAVRPPVWITTVGAGTLQPLAVATMGRGLETDTAAPLPALVHDPASADTTHEHDGGGEARAHAHPVGLLFIAAAGTVLVTGIALVLSLLLAVTDRLRGPGADPSESDGEGAAPAPEPTPSGTRWRERATEVLRAVVGGAIPPGGSAPSPDWDDPDHVGWRAMDFLAISVALLAFLAPLAYLNGVSAPWEVEHHGLNRWIGLTAVALLLTYVVLLVTWVARNVWRRRARSLAPLVDLEAHVMAVLLGALALVYWVQLRALRWEGVDEAAGAAASSLAFGLYRYRTLHLESATSGLLLFLLASLASAVAVVWHRNRRRILRGDAPPLEDLAPDPDADDPATPSDHWTRASRRMGEAMVEVRSFLEGRIDIPRIVAGGLLLLAPVGVGLLLWWPDVLLADDPWFSTPMVRTLDDLALDRGGWAATTRALWAGLLLGFGFTLLAAVHLLLVWAPFRRFLHALSSLPVAPALGRIPERLRTLGRLHLFDPPAEKLGQAQAETGHEAVWKAAEARLGTEPFSFMTEVLEDGIPDVSGLDSPRARAASLTGLMRVLRRVWTDHPELALDAPGASDERGDAGELERWVRSAELVVAIEVTRYVEWVLRNLRRIALLLLFTIVWTTAYLEAMPFPHHAAMTVVFIVLSIGGVGAVMGVMAHLSQDDVMSRINGTPPGKITWRSSSLLSAMAFVMIPVLGLLGTEVEPVGRVLFGWVSDILRVLSTG